MEPETGERGTRSTARRARFTVALTEVRPISFSDRSLRYVNSVSVTLSASGPKLRSPHRRYDASQPRAGALSSPLRRLKKKKKIALTSTTTSGTRSTEQCPGGRHEKALLHCCHFLAEVSHDSYDRSGFRDSRTIGRNEIFP